MSYKTRRWKWAWHQAGKAEQGFTLLVNKTPIPPLPSLKSFYCSPSLWAGCWVHPKCACHPLSSSPSFPSQPVMQCWWVGGSDPRPEGWDGRFCSVRLRLVAFWLTYCWAKGTSPAETPAAASQENDLLKIASKPFPWDCKAPRHWNMVPHKPPFLSLFMTVFHHPMKQGQSIPNVHSFPVNIPKLLGWPTTDKAGTAPDSFFHSSAMLLYLSNIFTLSEALYSGVSFEHPCLVMEDAHISHLFFILRSWGAWVRSPGTEIIEVRLWICKRHKGPHWGKLYLVQVIIQTFLINVK